MVVQQDWGMKLNISSKERKRQLWIHAEPAQLPARQETFSLCYSFVSVDATRVFHLLRDALCWSVSVIQRVHVCSGWTLIQTNNWRYKRNIVHKHLSSDVLHNFPSSLDAFYTLSWLDIVIVRKKNNSFASYCIIYIHVVASLVSPP